jgi:hypothetical protein
LQIIKVQELPEHVPTGEMPRNILISFDRHLVGRIQPGAVICAHGIFQICPPGNGKKASGANSAAVKSPYLRCVGVTEITGVGGRMTDTDFTAEEETKFRQMVQQPGFHEKLYKVDCHLISECLDPLSHGSNPIHLLAYSLPHPVFRTTFPLSQPLFPSFNLLQVIFGDITVILTPTPSLTCRA